MTANDSPTEESELTVKPSESSESALELLRTKHIPRLEAMLAEQQASGALKKDIAETQKWLNSANRSYKGLQKTIHELKRCQTYLLDSTDRPPTDRPDPLAQAVGNQSYRTNGSPRGVRSVFGVHVDHGPRETTRNHENLAAGPK